MKAKAKWAEGVSPARSFGACSCISWINVTGKPTGRNICYIAEPQNSHRLHLVGGQCLRPIFDKRVGVTLQEFCLSSPKVRPDAMRI